MTPDELNKEIALLNGWKPPGHPETEASRRTQASVGFLDPKYDAYWYHKSLFAFMPLPPDYAGDWQHCGPLLEEMLGTTKTNGNAVTFQRVNCSEKNRETICTWHRCVEMGGHRKHGTITTHAIAAAYYEWQKGKR